MIIQVAIKMTLKSPITQLENSKESLTSRMNHSEDRISGLKDKIGDLDKIIKNIKKIKTW